MPPAVAQPNTGAMQPPKAVKLSDDERPMIIRLQNLEKTYDIGTPRETKALRGVNLEISLAEIVVIFGQSGSGKSTMLNILAGLDNPTGGRLEIAGKDITKMNARDMAEFHQFKVGMVFQAYNLVQTFTVLQNITMPARLAGFKRKDYLARGWDLLREFDLEKLADRLPAECSGGQQQRVGIMRAFMNRPSFIIADEPTGNLDSTNSERIMQLFKQLNEETNTTMLIVTHDPSLFAIADRIVHVLDGKITKQTILTPKAKIDLKSVDVPVEFKLAPADQKKFIADMAVGQQTADGAAKVKAEAEKRQHDQAHAVQEQSVLQAKKLWLEDEARRIREQEEELYAMWQLLQKTETTLHERAQQLDQERAHIAKEGIKIGNEREQVLLGQLTLHHRQQEQREEAEQRTAIARHVFGQEQERLAAQEIVQEQTRQRVEQELAAREQKITATMQSVELLKKNVTSQHGRLNTLIAAKEKELSALRDERQALLAEQEKLTREQAALRAEQSHLQELRQALEQEALRKAEQRFHEAQQAVQQEQQRLAALGQEVTKQQSAVLAQQTVLEQERQQLSSEQAALRQDYQQLKSDREQLEQRSSYVAQEQVVAEETRAMFKARKAWLDEEQARLQAKESDLEEEQSAFQERQNNFENNWKVQQTASAERLTLMQKAVAQEKAEYEQQSAAFREEVAATQERLSLEQKHLQRDQATLRRQQAELAIKQEQLGADLQELKQQQEQQQRQETAYQAKRTRLEKEMQLQLSTARDILDHEKEQLEAERQHGVEQLQERRRTMERKITAARQIVDREMAVIEQEHRLLEQEKAVQLAEQQRLKKLRQQLGTQASTPYSLQPTPSSLPPHPRRRASLVRKEPHASAFDALLAEREFMSPTRQRIVSALRTIVPAAARPLLDRAAWQRLLEVIELRVTDILNQVELTSLLTTSRSERGVGLDAATAKHVAEKIEELVKKGKLH